MGDETARLRARVEQLEDELAVARVQIRRDAAHMALCGDVMQGVQQTRASVHLLQTANLRLRQQLESARKEIARLKQQTDQT